MKEICLLRVRLWYAARSSRQRLGGPECNRVNTLRVNQAGRVTGGGCELRVKNEKGTAAHRSMCACLAIDYGLVELSSK